MAEREDGADPEGFAQSVRELLERAAVVRRCRESGDWSELDAFDEAFGKRPE